MEAPPLTLERRLAAAALVRPGPGRGAWNPLPLARTCLVVLPADGVAPPAVAGGDGARHPLQVAAEGWLVHLALPPLAGTTLAALPSPAPGARWDVTPTVLDNGRVRVELDAGGGIARLCWDGVFADLAGPACRPPTEGAAEVTVEEAGPVRARVRVRHQLPSGRLDVAYSLLALDDHVLVEAQWFGQGECWLGHPTRQRAAELLVAGGTLPRRPDGPVEVRWASCAEAAGRGLALAAGAPVQLDLRDGDLLVRVGERTAFALASPRRGRGALTLGQLAEHLAVPAVPTEAPARPHVRLAEPTTLTPLWAARPEGCDGELLLAEQGGARTRAWLLADGARAGECWKADVGGSRLAACPVSPEGDGWQFDANPGELVRVRWRLPAPATP